MRHHGGLPTACAGMEGLSTEALEQVAAYFRALSEPTRLQILNLLRDGERNVGELAQLCGYTSANISRHLAFLMQQGLVARESRGTSVYYRFADDSVYALCDLVCGSIARQFERAAQGRRAFAQVGAQAIAKRPRSRG
jgi:DNA-binding transcriptional ArsR family regulator